MPFSISTIPLGISMLYITTPNMKSHTMMHLQVKDNPKHNSKAISMKQIVAYDTAIHAHTPLYYHKQYYDVPLSSSGSH